MILRYKYRNNVWWKKAQWQIAYAIEWRGYNEDQLTICFAGAWKSLLNRVFKQLQPLLVKSYDIEYEHSCKWRNGHVYHRLAVSVCQTDPLRNSVDCIRTLIEKLLHNQIRCNVKYFPNYEKFINL